ncbi:MAG TPA: hypothetical protein VLJ88_12850 [Propionibacteriaceae bacterium]|nr:hypothetical protein [Propionibacteriaceae bacterium]
MDDLTISVRRGGGQVESPWGSVRRQGSDAVALIVAICMAGTMSFAAVRLASEGISTATS